MGKQPGPDESENRSGTEKTRFWCSVYTRGRIRDAKGGSVTYDEYLNWLIDTAAEQYGTEDAPPLSKVGNNLIVETDQSE